MTDSWYFAFCRSEQFSPRTIFVFDYLMDRTLLRAARAVRGREPARARMCWAAVLVTAALAFCAAPTRAQGFTTPVNVSRDGTGNTPQVLVDSAGNIDIAYAEQTGTNLVGGIKFVRSTDRGKTFSKPVVIGLSNASHFGMALESDCTIDIAYFQSSDVFFSQSSDCGRALDRKSVV